LDHRSLLISRDAEQSAGEAYYQRQQYGEDRWASESVSMEAPVLDEDTVGRLGVRHCAHLAIQQINRGLTGGYRIALDCQML
jgi:hypothetical protein